MRILGLDVGDRTIGVAVSDELGFSAQPLKVIRRKKLESDLAELLELIASFSVEKIVVGIPKNQYGVEGPQAEKVREFLKSLDEVISIPVILIDERFTTAEAQKVLLSADARRSKRREVIDKLAASLILDSYLSQRQNSDNSEG